jgi:hypothetical protein
MRHRAIQCQIAAIGDHVINSSLEAAEMRNLAAALVDVASLLRNEATEREQFDREFFTKDGAA